MAIPSNLSLSSTASLFIKANGTEYKESEVITENLKPIFIPQDVLLILLKFLPVIELVKSRQVCRNWRQLIGSPYPKIQLVSQSSIPRIYQSLFLNLASHFFTGMLVFNEPKICKSIIFERKVEFVTALKQIIVFVTNSLNTTVYEKVPIVNRAQTLFKELVSNRDKKLSENEIIEITKHWKNFYELIKSLEMKLSFSDLRNVTVNISQSVLFMKYSFPGLFADPCASASDPEILDYYAFIQNIQIMTVVFTPLFVNCYETNEKFASEFKRVMTLVLEQIGNSNVFTAFTVIQKELPNITSSLKKM